jgi:hypothetical protein
MQARGRGQLNGTVELIADFLQALGQIMFLLGFLIIGGFILYAIVSS